MSVTVESLYGIFTGAENRVAGGEGTIGIYGSLTGASVQRIYDGMRLHTGFDTDSCLLDVGSGLGRPLLHAYYIEGIQQVHGIEIDPVKCIKAEAFAERVWRTLQERHRIPTTMSLYHDVTCTAIEDIHTIDPVTHVFAFWEGWAHASKSSLGTLFANSTTVKALVIIQRSIQIPEEVFEEEYEFGPVNIMDTIAVVMSGSGRKFTAYIISKRNA